MFGWSAGGTPTTSLSWNPLWHLVMAGTVVSLCSPALCHYCIADVGAELWIPKGSLPLGRHHKFWTSWCAIYKDGCRAHSFALPKTRWSEGLRIAIPIHGATGT